MTNITELQRLHNEIGRARDAYEKAFKKAFPKGTDVNFKKGRGTVVATVIEHIWGHRVRIKNLKTNKVYLIDGHWLLAGRIEKPGRVF
jgi:hypothetical protein